MKKLFLILLFIYVAKVTIFAQLPLLTNTLWKVEKYELKYKDKSKLLYQKDSVHNIIDYSNIEFQFLGDSICQAINDTLILTSKWFVNTKNDSLTMDETSYLILNATEEKFVLRSSDFAFVDTLATIDTVYYDMHFVELKKITTHVHPLEENLIFNVFPNPTSGHLVIKPRSDHPLSLNQIIVTNSFGNVIQKETITTKNNSYPIDIRNQSNGVYFIQIYDEENVRIGFCKILKEK